MDDQEGSGKLEKANLVLGTIDSFPITFIVWGSMGFSRGMLRV